MTAPDQRPDPYAAFTDSEGYNPFLDESPIDQDGVLDLLSLLAGADYRKADPAVAMAWTLASQEGRWSTGQAFRAAARHITANPEPAKPAHITALIKLERDTVPDNRLALPAAPPASDEARASALAAYRVVAARHPEVAQIGRLPWSKQTRRPRASDDDVRSRVVADLDARRRQAEELERRRARGDFLRGDSGGGS